MNSFRFEKLALLLLQWVSCVVITLITIYVLDKTKLLFKLDDLLQVFIAVSLSLLVCILALFFITPVAVSKITKNKKLETKNSNQNEVLSTEKISDIILIFISAVTILCVAGGAEIDTGKIGMKLAYPLFCSSAIVIYYKIKP